jgi:hypothetical protein
MSAPLASKREFSASSRAARRIGGSSGRPNPNAMHKNALLLRSYRQSRRRHRIPSLAHTSHDASALHTNRVGPSRHASRDGPSRRRANRDDPSRRDGPNHHGELA